LRRGLPISKVVDIRNDLANVQARIAQIAGGPAAFAPPVAGGAFASLVNAVFPQTSVPVSSGSGTPMQWPVAGQITSPFGERKNPMGAGQDFHPGLDIAADEGTPIAAASAGRVISAGPDGGYGNLIVVDDGNGVTTRYGHCSQIFARVGDLISPGQTIGAVGSTGHSTGPHLHFEVRMNDRPVDPAQFLAR
jgi:murein DD-endopeptidase MepM/ murein hydrolase activator NlpD